jgi:hypothetical protein
LLTSSLSTGPAALSDHQCDTDTTEEQGQDYQANPVHMGNNYRYVIEFRNQVGSHVSQRTVPYA